jgi:hypothetical protein
MNKIKGDEPAMPTKITQENKAGSFEKNFPGLTIRQHYAGLAMQGLLAAVDQKDFESTELVTASVRIADELIAALNS